MYGDPLYKFDWVDHKVFISAVAHITHELLLVMAYKSTCVKKLACKYVFKNLTVTQA